MRRLLGWVAGLVGIAALARLVARRRARTAEPPPVAGEPDDPAAELRRKLAESRGDDAAGEGPADGPEPPAAPEGTLEERRARVHAKAQEAIDAMREPES